MKRSACYVRMSTDKQECSIDSQLRLIREYSSKNNLEILDAHIYSDEGISGREADKRPAFLQMIEDSSKGLFDLVLIYDSSRFARNLEQSIVYKSILKRNNVQLVSITEPVLDDDTSLITDALLGAMNEMYSRKLAKVVLRGMEQSVLNGKYISCSAFGYDRIESGKPLVINENESKIVCLIFDLFYKHNMSSFLIARKLNSIGFKTKRNNTITKRWVDNILKNPIYKGYVKWQPGKNSGRDAIIVKADHSAIIDEQYFDDVQKKISTQNKNHCKKQRTVDVYKHWLSGILRCSMCNSIMVYVNGWNGRKDRFRCGGYASGGCLNSKTMRVEDFEMAVMKKIKEICSYSVLNYSLNTRVIDIDDALPIMQNLENEVKKAKNALSRAKVAFLNGVDTIEEYKDNKNELTAYLDKMENEIEHLRNKAKPVHSIKNKFGNVIDILESSSDMFDKKNVARSLFSKIMYYPKSDSIVLYFLLG